MNSLVKLPLTGSCLAADYLLFLVYRQAYANVLQRTAQRSHNRVGPAGAAKRRNICAGRCFWRLISRFSHRRAVIHHPTVEIGLGAAWEALDRKLLADHLNDRQIDDVIPAGNRFVAIDCTAELLTKAVAVGIDMPHQF